MASRAFVVSSPSSSHFYKGPAPQINEDNQQATNAKAFLKMGSCPPPATFSLPSTPLISKKRGAFAAEAAVMIAKLRSISEIAPLTDDESDALTKDISDLGCSGKEVM
jgi:hypothetical protein